MVDETLEGDPALSATMASDQVQPLAPSSPLSRGALIGRYVVLSKLGAGAMGVVYAAYDPELDRKVALKLLKSRSEAREAARIRLRREARALARLDHPNVIGVHDVGVHDDQLFIGMEFVEGLTLREWMAQVERPRPWAQVLSVFTEAGRGLAAAHAVGLIHRDFKPDNVMLGDDGRVRVMDFGLARGHADELGGEGGPSLGPTAVRASPPSLTLTGTMLGTPAYMSPEQFEGASVDARSDQFGFCVSLYEGLYGERPFAGKTLAELIAAALDGTLRPPPPDAKVPRWLREVVARGLAVRPEQRWPSMDALLAALARDPRAQRRRWLRRAALVGLLGAAVGGAVIGLRADAQTCEGMEDHLVGVWDEARKVELEAAFAATPLSYTAQAGAHAKQRLDGYASDWLAAREQACEATHRGEQSWELLDLRMACLDERLLHLRATVDVLAGADETVVNKTSELVGGLPRLAGCTDVDALRAPELAPETPALARRVAALDERLVEAEVLERAGKYAQGLEQIEVVVAEALTLGHEPLQVRAWLQQGDAQENVGDYEAAVRTLEQAYAGAVGLGMRAEAAESAARIMVTLGYRLARLDEGRSWAKHAEPLTRVADTDEAWTLYLNGRGLVAERAANYEDAQGYHERALAIWERAWGPDDLHVAISLNNLGNVAWGNKQFDAARSYYERTLAIREQIMGPNHPQVAYCLNNLGSLAWTEGKLDEVRAHYERALAIMETSLRPDHPDLGQSIANLGILAYGEGRLDDARAHYERAQPILEAAFGPDHPDMGDFFNMLAALDAKEGKRERARAQYERALAIHEAALGPDHPRVTISLSALAELARADGRYEDARACYERLLAVGEKTLEPGDPELADALYSLGMVWLDLSRPAEALPVLARALELRAADADEPTELAHTRFALARALWDAPDGDARSRALTLAEQARAVYEGDAELTPQLEAVQAWLAAHE